MPHLVRQGLKQEKVVNILVNFLLKKDRLGNLLLQRIANCIQEIISKESIAMRVGGDEFLILCLHYNHQQAEKRIEQLKIVFIRKQIIF
ncbi:diguanylate cyclase [Coprobacillus sp. AF34-1BH]|jgi:sensory box protein|nr:diguanylate cyclase [Coprobacillus sp. AF18-40]RGT86554.1 diguanylate cyclase [Coprobacillus sp. AF18-15LB]RHH06314.1 diguanylate cyclase [Coprobacillus sp. AM18-4LB-d2]RHP24506.1 diguanylate cyclase [Coprobacillus sp. AF34-1BH]